MPPVAVGIELNRGLLRIGPTILRGTEPYHPQVTVVADFGCLPKCARTTRDGRWHEVAPDAGCRGMGASGACKPDGRGP